MLSLSKSANRSTRSTDDPQPRPFPKGQTWRPFYLDPETYLMPKVIEPAKPRDKSFIELAAIVDTFQKAIFWECRTDQWDLGKEVSGSDLIQLCTTVLKDHGLAPMADEEPQYDALLQPDEDAAVLDCGCQLKREFGDGSVSITFCDGHQ